MQKVSKWPRLIPKVDLVKTQYKKLSPEVIKEELLSVKVGIIKNRMTKKKYILPTKINKDARQIYRVSGIKIPDKVQIVA